jgi:CDP-glycerol glycerophosphotransferase (TagB/SpsB family)
MLFARSFVIDHEYQSLLFSTLRTSVPVVQLWHGLPYKHLSGNSHYPNINDACFISSSNWFNKEIFEQIFNSKRFLGIGYPRNDVFFQTQEERCWVNSEPLSVLKNTINITGEIIIYAPTYRDSQDNNYPLNLAEINDWCIKHQCSFILKYHPFIYRTVTEKMGISATEQLIALPDYSHIYIFPNGKNVYPWLADAVMLITDYSSIAFDFMLSGKPILYYQYDKEEYESIRGKPLVGDDVFINGKVVTKFDELLLTMENVLRVESEQMPKKKKSPINDQLQACTEKILMQLALIEGEM